MYPHQNTSFIKVSDHNIIFEHEHSSGKDCFHGRGRLNCSVLSLVPVRMYTYVWGLLSVRIGVSVTENLEASSQAEVAKPLQWGGLWI